MNFYRAIMQAAAHIEQHPRLFEYSVNEIPKCGSHGCALGWIGHFAGLPVDNALDVPDLLGDGDIWVFAERMEELADGSQWRHNASVCARALRLYAAKYHAPTRRTDSELVADLMARVCGERIPEEA